MKGTFSEASPRANGGMEAECGSEQTDLGGDPMVDGGGVGLLPALCLRRMAWVLFTLLTESGLSPSSAAKAAHSDR